MQIHILRRVARTVVACVLTACGGGGDDSGTAGMGASGQPGSASTAGSGRPGLLAVTVTTQDGEPLAEAEVAALGTSQVWAQKADSSGKATLSLPASSTVRVSVSHPLGHATTETLSVPGGSTIDVSIAVPPAIAFASVLLPVNLQPSAISADRKSADFGFSIFSRAFTQSSYKTPGPLALDTPLVRLGDCVVWLDSVRTKPDCSQWSDGTVNVTSFEFSAAGRRVYPESPAPLATVLLLDQSNRAMDYDPWSLRRLAAQWFIHRARNGPITDLVAVAGFAGPDAGGMSAPTLPLTPLWLPAGGFSTTADRAGALEAVKALVPRIGGGAPLFDALDASIRLLSSSSPATARRTIVAIVGGGDSGALSADQRQRRLASLRQLQQDANVEIILIPGELPEKSPERPLLAEIAEALHAPQIFAGLPKGWASWPNGLHTAMNIAADMLTGVPLQTIDVVFRLPARDPAGFVAGSRYEGSLAVESDFCPMGCAEPPMNFSVVIP